MKSEVFFKSNGETVIHVEREAVSDLLNVLDFVAERYSGGRTNAEKKHAEHIREGVFRLAKAIRHAH